MGNNMSLKAVQVLRERTRNAAEGVGSALDRYLKPDETSASGDNYSKGNTSVTIQNGKVISDNTLPSDGNVYTPSGKYGKSNVGFRYNSKTGKFEIVKNVKQENKKQQPRIDFAESEWLLGKIGGSNDKAQAEFWKWLKERDNQNKSYFSTKKWEDKV